MRGERGRANWWIPGWLDGLLPRHDAEPRRSPTPVEGGR